MPRFDARADYYRILGLGPTCSQAELKAAFRRRVFESHPDRGGDARELRAVLEAHSVLGDGESRAAYDAARAPRATTQRRGKRTRARSKRHPGRAASARPSGWVEQTRSFIGRLEHVWMPLGRSDPRAAALLGLADLLISSVVAARTR